jgi:hypothetical protein
MVAPPLFTGGVNVTTADVNPAVANRFVGGSGCEVSEVIVTEPIAVPIPVELDWDAPLL